MTNSKRDTLRATGVRPSPLGWVLRHASVDRDLDDEMSQVDVTKLVPGTRYRIELDDCCIEGEVTGVFSYYDLDEGGDPDAAVFDFGRIGPMWGQWTAELQEEG